MKNKTSSFPQYIYFSILLSVGQRRLKTIAVANSFGGRKMGINRWTSENGKELQEGELTRQNMNSAFNGSLSFSVSPVIQLPQTCRHGWSHSCWLLMQTCTSPHSSCLKWPLPGSLVITLTVIAMTDHFINCKLHYLKMVTTDIGKGTEYPNFS